MNGTEGHTKFKLKPEEEILSILRDKQKILIFTCKKCFNEFNQDTETEFNKLQEIINKNNISIAENVELDFLCNTSIHNKKIKQIDTSEVDSIAVISCGIGIQNFANFFIDNKPVYSLTDSIPQGGYHGPSLSPQKCGACAQCYLDITGGFCPIVDCAKSLLNGPCGGAKQGRCEVKIGNGQVRDCAWEKIYSKLKATNRVNFNLELSVQLRDFSKPGFISANKHKNLNQEKRQQNFYGGLYLYERKEITKDSPIEQFPEPEIVVIPLSQHTGTSSKPIVKVGERVKAGQKIGDASGQISSLIHSSVSGKVIAIEERLHPTVQKKVLSVVIENDKRNELFEGVNQTRKNIDSLKRNELLQIIRESGIVGLGGAMFPTYLKLQPPKPVDTLIINGCECEPYLSSDYRVMIERAECILKGIEILKKILEVKKVTIAIEDNKPEAIERFKNNIDTIELKTKYPQGAERMLIKKVTDREVPVGKLPFDVGVIVSNISTAFAVYDAVFNNIPLIKRVITISGDNDISKFGNYEIKIGTLLTKIIDKISPDYCVKMGGPMMGITQTDLNVPVIKGTTGIILIKNPDIESDKDRKCIKCGRCVDACPMELYPMYYVFYEPQDKWQKMQEYNVTSCIECGCCDYICSSKISIVNIIKQAKKKLCLN